MQIFPKSFPSVMAPFPPSDDDEYGTAATMAMGNRRSAATGDSGDLHRPFTRVGRLTHTVRFSLGVLTGQRRHFSHGHQPSGGCALIRTVRRARVLHLGAEQRQ